MHAEQQFVIHFLPPSPHGTALEGRKPPAHLPLSSWEMGPKCHATALVHKREWGKVCFITIQFVDGNHCAFRKGWPAVICRSQGSSHFSRSMSIPRRVSACQSLASQDITDARAIRVGRSSVRHWFGTNGAVTGPEQKLCVYPWGRERDTFLMGMEMCSGWATSSALEPQEAQISEALQASEAGRFAPSDSEV